MPFGNHLNATKSGWFCDTPHPGGHMRAYGIVVPIGLAFADGIARGALSSAESIGGITVRICREALNPEALTAWLSWAAPDGVIHFATVPSRYRRPHVQVCQPGGTAVLVDETAIGALAAEHLLDRMPATLVVVDSGAAWSNARADAFIATCARAGRTATRLREGAWDRPAGRRRLLTRLQVLPRPVACFAGNDRTAVAVADAITAAGMMIGRDVLLLGADDDDLDCRSVHPHLSSVQVPWERVGDEALRLLHHGHRRTVVVPPTGVAVRGSSDALRLDDRALSAAVCAARAGADGVDAMAVAAGLHRRALERRCRTLLGHSPLVLLQRTRIDTARRLLLSGSTVATAATQCGWTSRAAFLRAFRQATGETPGAWRDHRH